MIEQALAEAKGEVILLGDMNIHHPRWGGRHIATEPQAEHLLNAVEVEGLHLLTPPGEPTWKRGEQESVIDLTFASQGVLDRLEFCGTEERWAISRDHIPISIRANFIPKPPAPSKRFALKYLNREKFRDQIKVIE